MVKVKPFGVERWMDTYEGTCKYNIAETCCSSLSITDLVALSADPSGLPLLLSKKLTYGSIPGSEQLRANIAALYPSPTIPADNVLVCPGAISANFLLLYTIMGPGDHVICVYPTYQQLYSVPESLGAEVSLWRLRKSNKFVPDVEDLKGLIKPNTKLIIINNPNNPTGSTIPQTVLQDIVEVAISHDIYLLSDEVYRPLFHSLPSSDAQQPPSILSFGYSKAIATGSLSKAYALAGIRVGWIAAQNPSVIEACSRARDYTTISVSQLDDQIAAFALSSSVIHNLLNRNMTLTKMNLAILEDFVTKFSKSCSWVKPTAGTTAFLKFYKDGHALDGEALCKAVFEKSGVLMVPGEKCFGAAEGDFEGYVRIGYACDTKELEKGLSELGNFLKIEPREG